MSEKVTSSILISGSGTPEPKVYMAAPEKIPINREEKTSLVIRALERAEVVRIIYRHFLSGTSKTTYVHIIKEIRRLVIRNN